MKCNKCGTTTCESVNYGDDTLCCVCRKLLEKQMDNACWIRLYGPWLKEPVVLEKVIK